MKYNRALSSSMFGPESRALVMQVDQEDILEILHHFAALDDPRSHVNRKHLLGDLIVICVCGVLSGCDGPIAIGQWTVLKKDWLKEHLELPGGIPSHDTLGASAS
jgi:hypothetical protein